MCIAYPLLLSLLNSRIFAGVIVSVDLDPRESVTDEGGGYRVVELRFPPVRVVIFLQTAYDAGVQLPGLARGEIAVGAETRSYTVSGLHDRKFFVKRTQIPLLPGHLSSVYRAQVRFFSLDSVARCSSPSRRVMSSSLFQPNLASLRALSISSDTGRDDRVSPTPHDETC